MEIERLPLDKLSYFVAGIVPGSTAIYVYYLSNPGAFHDFLMPNAFGYGTKLGIALGVSFVIGHTLTRFLNAFLGAIGGMIGAFLASKEPKGPFVPQTAPWRDPKWRKLAIRYLGDHSPADTVPNPDSSANAAIDSRTLVDPAQYKLLQDRIGLASNDHEWSQWYKQLDRQRLAEQKVGFTEVFAGGLATNIQATALYMLVSMAFVPVVRNWICICFCCISIPTLVAESYVEIRKATDPWNTWADQFDFLAHKALTPAESGRVVKPVE